MLMVEPRGRTKAAMSSFAPSSWAHSLDTGRVAADEVEVKAKIMAAIGLAESLHAANRGEKITTIFINNTVYGMTGGQMAPTTLVGQKTTTTCQGRSLSNEGGPVRLAEIMAQLDGVAYAARCALDSVKHVRAAKRAMRKAFEVQLDGLGFGFVELLSGCPTNWHLDPVAANRRIAEAMIPVFPLGVFKDATTTAPADAGQAKEAPRG